MPSKHVFSWRQAHSCVHALQVWAAGGHKQPPAHTQQSNHCVQSAARQLFEQQLCPQVQHWHVSREPWSTHRYNGPLMPVLQARHHDTEYRLNLCQRLQP
jgi:hypothetical protein